jgi:hypothetical protein
MHASPDDDADHKPELPVLLTLVAAAIRASAVLWANFELYFQVDRGASILEGSGRIRIIDSDGRSMLDRPPIAGRSGGRMRACIAGDDTLMQADPADGMLHRWQIVRTTPPDEGH